MSTVYCGCDPEAGWTCKVHQALEKMPEPEQYGVKRPEEWTVKPPKPIQSAAEQYADWVATKLTNVAPGAMRTFDTGATRHTDENKPDYEGFLSPLVIARFGQYMAKHRVQADGGIRDSDNWQKGIPRTAYMKSLWRHFVDLWTLHRRAILNGIYGADAEEACCAILFNVQGYLHEILKNQTSAVGDDNTPDGRYSS